MDKIENTVINDPGQSGIALLIALIMLLVLSVMAISLSFVSNLDFQGMQEFKRGQEAFISAEICVMETRFLLETEGFQNMLFKGQKGFKIVLGDGDPAKNINPICRTGRRHDDSADLNNAFLAITSDIKARERPVENTSIPSGNVGGATAVPLSFSVIGKDGTDPDKDDSDDDINTGIELAVGIEVFMPGGANNIY